jgi:nascent polypeptide-associated complex subunit alpha
MGIQQVEIPANEVIIKTDDKEIVISDPQVSKVNMMGQETFQVVGNITEKATTTEPEINKDDIKTVMQQADCSEEEAIKAVKQANGNLAEAILKLKG